MYLLAAFVLLFSSPAVHSGEQTEHRDFQYKSDVDPLTGRYNFAYDTGNDNNEIAHSTHMEYRDANGMVRGRYGYTDPNGKLRVVEYEAGPNGFVARGDVGPDSFPHDQTPETQLPQFARYSQEDVNLHPRPIQMAGWDPIQDPMGQPVSSMNDGSALQGENGTQVDSSGSDAYSNSNNSQNEGSDAYVPVIDPYSAIYPGMFLNTQNENPGARELEALTPPTAGDENNSDMIQEQYPSASPLNVNNIDVNPNEIRQSGSGQVLTARSADGDTARSSQALSYRNPNYIRQTHDHDGEIASPYVSLYIPSHGHYHYVRVPHDHEAEKKYARQTHDHDAEMRRYYLNRQTHDHDAEMRRYYINRQTHDHDAELRRYFRNRQTHDHDAELRRYYDYRRAHNHGDEVSHTIYHQNNPSRRRIYYKDSHSNIPHEHYNDIYHNDASHRHSDVQLYGRSQALEVPPTAQPAQLKYISSDKYHDKYYYWTD